MNQLKNTRAQFWAGRIDEMLKNFNYKSAHETLRGIKETLEETGEATPRQVQAIKNIRWGRNELRE